MKKAITIFATILALMTTTTFAQTTFKEHKAGHVFYISLPDYMMETAGENTAASIQFKNTIKDVAGFVIEDSKAELKILELNYPTLNDFYEEFIKDFIKDEKKRKISKPESKKIGEYNFMECDASYYEPTSKIEIYYFVGLVETPTYYYKLLCYGSLENKDKFKADFQKILYSLKD